MKTKTPYGIPLILPQENGARLLLLPLSAGSGPVKYNITLERLRRQINAEARRSVLQIILALALAFGLGVLTGRYG